MEKKISSKENPTIRHIHKLTVKRDYRYACGEYVCEGLKLLDEALNENVEIRVVLLDEEREIDGFAEKCAEKGIECAVIPTQLMLSITTMETSPGAMFTCAMPEIREFEGNHFLVLDGIQDAGNMGTMIRTADAFGMDGIYLAKGCVDVYNPKTIRACMGASFRMKVRTIQNEALVDELKRKNVPLYSTGIREGALVAGQADLHHCAVIIGSEGNGVSDELKRLADGEVTIPMCGKTESLNAATAAAIIMWEMTK